MPSRDEPRPELLPLAQVQIALPEIGATLRGVSVAGYETWITVPQWSLAFDVGRAATELVHVKTLALTHAHMDHAGGLPSLLSLRKMLSAQPLEVLAPAEACDDLRQAVAVWERIHNRQFLYTLVPMHPGDEHPIGGGRRLRAFRSDHVIATCGYAVIATTKKLLPQHVGKPPSEIRGLLNAGVVIDQARDRVLLAITGDTRPTVYASSRELQQAEVALHEATYLDDHRTNQQANDKGHSHFDQWLQSVVDYAPVSQVLVPYHVSRAYSAPRARQLMQAKMSPQLWARTRPFLP